MSGPTFELSDAVMRAGAGAGKTTELTLRVLELAKSYKQKHQRSPHFVVTTFTRKATQELKERLLKKALQSTDTPWLVDFVKSSSQLHISTIHGLLSLYLTRFGSIMNLSPRLRMISSHRSLKQLKQIIRSQCESNDSFRQNFQELLEGTEFSDLLEGFQRYFGLKMQFGNLQAYAEEDFTKILAKTKSELFSAMEDLSVELSVPEAAKAWADLGNYLKSQKKLGQACADINQWASDFVANIPSTRKGKDTPESWLDLRKQIQDQADFFCQWKTQKSYFTVHADMVQRFQACAEEITKLLLEKKLKSGEITMSDLESLSLKLAREHPETAAAFSKQWNYWLVDEYQDTSPAQVELLHSLMGESKIFVVGDPQQSIYLFRGARSEVFVNQEKESQKRGGELLSKRINYRSNPDLLQFFNFVFTNLGAQFQTMQPNPDKKTKNEQATAEILVIPKPEKDAEVDPELSAILFRCQELLKQGVPAEDIAVLSRNNRDLENLAWMARDFSIPVQVHSSGKFFDRREVVDALTVLKFLCNPHDNKNLIQLLRSPGFYLEDQTLADWCAAGGVSYWAQFSKQTAPIIHRLKALLEKTEEQGIGQVWVDALIEQDLFAFAQSMDSSGKREANLWKLVQMIRLEERRPGFSYLAFLKELDLQSSSTEEMDQGDAIPVMLPSRINLMTVHASKGLEFGHVIIGHVGDGPPAPRTEFFHADENTGRWSISPLEMEAGKKESSLSTVELNQILKQRQKEEDERIFYVALTRAKLGVTLVLLNKFSKNSWLPRLNLKFTEGLYDQEGFSYRVREGEFAPTAQAAESKVSRKIPEPFLAPKHIERQIVSVTEILDSTGVVAKGDTAREKKPNLTDIQKALTGVQVHRLLEDLKYRSLRDPQFDWQKLSMSSQEQKALGYVLQDQQGMWQNLILKGEVEYGFSVLHGNNLIQGQIDLWGTDKDGTVWVADYKTGNPKYQDKAFEQLKIYAWALVTMKKIKHGSAVRLAVIYPFSEITKVESFLSTFSPPL